VTVDGGRFPEDRASLLALPGIGPYTAAAIAAIAFDRPETVVDGNVERVVARLFAVEVPLPRAKGELTALAAGLTPKDRPGDFAQAMMDLGATICTPRNPACALCPLAEICRGRAEGIAPDLPRKAAKPEKPERRGTAWVAIREDGAVLLERRPPKGLLGGMLGFPGTDWSEAPAGAPPLRADWRVAVSTVRHTFTHFHLSLSVEFANVPMQAAPDLGEFVARADYRPADLPTLMRKVHDAASAAFAQG
jgi:A/G-specific adenine glycosylase